MTPGVVAESDLAGALKSEYVFFGEERVVRRDLSSSASVAYYFSDHLKTASVIADAIGNIRSLPLPRCTTSRFEVLQQLFSFKCVPLRLARSDELDRIVFGFERECQPLR